jgi:superfamily I DNA/RNA helicase
VGVIRARPSNDSGSLGNPIRPTEAQVLDESVIELTIGEAVGLEFDSVIIVEPARFSEAELYVAMTRTTSRLTLVHAQPLPSVIQEELATRITTA